MNIPICQPLPPGGGSGAGVVLPPPPPQAVSAASAMSRIYVRTALLLVIQGFTEKPVRNIKGEHLQVSHLLRQIIRPIDLYEHCRQMPTVPVICVKYVLDRLSSRRVGSIS
jgi:hypothetical protein